MSFEKHNKGIKQIFIGLSFALILIAVSIGLFVLLYFSQQNLATLGEIRYQSNLIADQLRQSSDELTRLVRTYAVTRNEKFEKQFWDVLAIRNGKKPRPLHYDRIYWDFLTVENGKPPYPSGKAVSMKSLMKEAGFSKRELALLAEAQKNSDELVSLEKKAMDAIKGKGSKGVPDQKMALDILFGEEYHQDKIKIMAPINTFLKELDQRTQKQVSREAFRLKLLLFTQIFNFIAIIATIVVLMKIAKNHHLNMINLLSSKIRERTSELKKTNKFLKKEIENREIAEQKIKILKGLLPICSSCKKIRDDKGYWKQIEGYILEHSEAEFSHGICPECAKNLYPDFCDEVQK